MYELNSAVPGWGSSSIPSKVAEQLKLNAHLAKVPQDGLVVDVGAGVGFGMAAFIYLTRPDITVVSVDPGYVEDPNTPELVEGREIIINNGCEDERQRELLRSTDAWYSDMRHGFAEDLPIDSTSVDLLVSYAAIPEYAESPEQSLKECVRVLKLGTTALHGPMYEPSFEIWEALLGKAKQDGEVKEFRSEQQDIQVGSNNLQGVYFTALQK